MSYLTLVPENEGVESLFNREAVSRSALCSPVAVEVAGSANIGDTMAGALS